PARCTRCSARPWAASAASGTPVRTRPTCAPRARGSARPPGTSSAAAWGSRLVLLVARCRNLVAPYLSLAAHCLGLWGLLTFAWSLLCFRMGVTFSASALRCSLAEHDLLELLGAVSLRVVCEVGAEIDLHLNDAAGERGERAVFRRDGRALVTADVERLVQR